MNLLNLSNVRSAARFKGGVSPLSVPAFYATPRSGCKEFRSVIRPGPDALPGRRIAGVPSSSRRRQQSGIQ